MTIVVVVTNLMEWTLVEAVVAGITLLAALIVDSVVEADVEAG